MMQEPNKLYGPSLNDDSKSKLERFEKTPFYIVSTGMTEQEKEQNSRDYYQRCLQMMENNVVGFLEELNLIIDTNKQSTKLSKIEGEIEEKKLEAKRRKTVVETKVYGAEIEIITILREELKRRGENTKVIAELNSKISRIEDAITQFQKQKDAIKTVPSDNENQEDKYHNDIVKKTEDE